MNDELEKRKPGNQPGENHATTAEERQQRTMDVVDLVSKGYTKKQIREKLELDDTTLWRTMKELDLATIEVFPQTVALYQAYRERERLRLELQRDEVLESVSIRPRDKHVLLLQIHEKLASLLNLSSEVFLPKDADDSERVVVRRIVIESVHSDMQPEVVSMPEEKRDGRKRAPVSEEDSESMA